MKKRKEKEKKSCNKSVKLHFYYSTQNYDDSITRYFPFSKRKFSQKSNVVFTQCMGKFQAVFLIMLFLLANLKLMSAFYSLNVSSLQVGDI